MYRALGHGITCIDAAYGAPGLACFYLLEQDGEGAIIETGTSHSVANLLEVLRQKKLLPEQVRYVVPTHVHLDHAGGAGAMMALFPNAELIVHPRGARHLIDPTKLIASSIAVYGESAFHKLYGDIVAVPEERLIEAADYMRFAVGSRQLLIRHTRGHADHHFCVWDEVSRGWFSGDMFGVSYQGMRFPKGNFTMASTTPTQFEPERYLESVNLLESVAPKRMYLTHFGELIYTPALAAALCQQVVAYRDFALAFAENPEVLEDHIVNYTLERIASVDDSVDPAQLRQMIEFDARLNAQGLQVWLNRQRSGAR